MGKQGPCCHCGVTSTPLWRNGPADKPVLCNACGSRWRTKGSLANYTPLNLRAEPEDSEINKLPRVKTISLNKQKEVKLKLVKRKQSYDCEGVSITGASSDNRSFCNFKEHNASNRSSSGSAISNSESCGQFSKFDASEFTEADKSIANSVVTPKKKIVIPRSQPSPVQKLTRDLCTILHEQQSHFSGSSEEDLLFDTDASMASAETGHGSVLIKLSTSIGQEDDSEASSLTFDNKPSPGQRSYFTPNNLVGNTNIKVTNFEILGIEKSQLPTGHDIQQEQIIRAKLQNEKLQILGNHNSPLCIVDLKEILNYKEFEANLTSEEQQRLLKYLPTPDTASYPDSFISMFDSSHFKENKSSFQQLLAEGVFDISMSGVKAEDCKTLRRFALSNLTKSKWVEHHNQLKKCKNGFTSYAANYKPNTLARRDIFNLKRPRDGSNSDVPDAKSSIKCPKKADPQNIDKKKEPVENVGSCFSPRSLFTIPQDSSSLKLDSFQYDDENPDHDLLLDVPFSNSFPQAELLRPTSSYGILQPTSSCNSSLYPNPIRH